MVEALVTSSLMRWARERAGLSASEAAKKLKRPEEEILAWESGTKKPTIAQARRASEVYRRPLALFFLPEPPLEFDTLRDFRRLPAEESRTFNRDILEVIRVAAEHQQWTREFMEEEGVAVLPFVGSATIKDNPRDIAEDILRTFEILPDEQCKAQSRYYALRLWISRVESKGVFVFRRGGINLRECRGFVLSDSIAPFIYLNSEDAEAAMMFTLVHEIAHLWLDSSGISNLGVEGEFVTSAYSNVEVFCNQVASDVLIYAERFEREIERLSSTSTLTIEEKVERLSRVFKVSEEAIARKLLRYNYITESKYRRLREHYNDRWIELREIQEQKDREKRGGPTYYTTKVSSNGLLYTQTVIGAYLGGRISGRDASSLLDVKLNNLSSLAIRARMPLQLP